MCRVVMHEIEKVLFPSLMLLSALVHKAFKLDRGFGIIMDYNNSLNHALLIYNVKLQMMFATNSQSETKGFNLSHNLLLFTILAIRKDEDFR